MEVCFARCSVALRGRARCREAAAVVHCDDQCRLRHTLCLLSAMRQSLTISNILTTSLRPLQLQVSSHSLFSLSLLMFMLVNKFLLVSNQHMQKLFPRVNVKLFKCCITAGLKLMNVIQAPQYYQCSICLLYTSPSPRDRQKSRMPSSA